MARQEVVQVKCDRCKRVELQPVLEVEKIGPDFEARLGDKRLVYADLCGSCWKAIANTWVQLEEWDREVKQELLGQGPVQGEKAPPLTVAPDYSPPKPHSAAGAKRS